MTPKEKAEELVRTYYTWGINKEGQTLSWLEAKQCALIAVEEISKVVNDIWMDSFTTGESDNKFYNYWQEVKKEIEKI
jgi:hypothetical protein